MTTVRRAQALVAALLWWAGAALAQDTWPREYTRQASRLVIYAPQVDEWKDFRSLQWRSALELTPGQGAKPIVGAVGLHADTLVDNDSHVVMLANIRITHSNFPALDAASAAQAAQLLNSFVPQTASIALHRIVASTPKPATAPTVAVRNEPPRILVSNEPAVLVFVDGAPVRGKIGSGGLEFVVNTSLPIFFDGDAYYLLAGERWMRADQIAGPWSAARRLPRALDQLGNDPQWDDIAKFIPPKRDSEVPAPRVFYSDVPADVVLFDGKPSFTRVTGTGLLYATNTDSAVFMHEATQQVYYLSAGRWFRAASLDGPWAFATADLPPDFARIPPNTPPGRVLASVPGTEEAKDAVLMAQIPTTLTVSAEAANKVRVAYDGAPKFEPIPNTSLAYAVNTADKVIRIDDRTYYLCLQGVWFLSTTASGPWQVAPSVPQAIYTIPSSSPVYNVTYVTQVTTPTGSVQSSYTAGYMGAFVVGAAVGATIAYGSGYYHPPYVYMPPVGYPVYRPYPMPYGAPVATATGAYGWSQAAYGPYGGATRTATYNPYTGTSARTATAVGPYGSRSAGQAYNPYTGTYAATAQGSSPTAQWGSSEVSRGNQSATMQHTTTAAGTTGSIQTSAGGQAVGAERAGGGGASVARSASGDYYASHDGNVYRNTGSGWQSYDNGSWNTAQRPQSPTSAQTTQPRPQGEGTAPSRPSGEGTAEGRSQSMSSSMQRGGAPTEQLQQERESRERGAYQSGQFERARGGGGGGFGGRRR